MRQRYNTELIKEKVEKRKRNDLLQEKNREKQDQKRIPLVLTYNQFLSNFKGIIP